MAHMDAEGFAKGDAEVFVLMKAFDEGSSQTVHSRTSYKYQEIAFGARYADIFVQAGGTSTIDMKVLSTVIKL
jgi:inward rectifier potassium channel